MEMVVKFESVAEVKEFVSMFGSVAGVPVAPVNVSVDGNKVAEIISEGLKQDKPKETKVNKSKAQKEEKKEVPKVEAENVGVAEDDTPEVKDVDQVKEDDKQETKVTKEMVRAAFTKVIQAGKQKEAKELTAKYGASKLAEVKEEDYPAILKDAEALV